MELRDRHAVVQVQGGRLTMDSDDDSDESLRTRGWDLNRLPAVSRLEADAPGKIVISAPLLEPCCISRRTCWKRSAHQPRASRSCWAGLALCSASCVEGLFGRGRPLARIAETDVCASLSHATPGVGATSFPDCVGNDKARSVCSAHS